MEKNIYITAADLLAQGQKVALARIIKRSGSTPRDVGSACLVTQSKELIGTVGGGMLEFKVHQKAAQLLETGKSYIYEFKLSGNDLANEGMICGGNVDLFIEPLFPDNPQTVTIFESIRTKLEKNQAVILAGRVENGIDAMAQDARVLFSNKGKIAGDLSGFDIPENYFDMDFSCQMIDSIDGRSKTFLEKLTANPNIFLFGAGHVSKFVVQFAKMVDFDITVIDDREEFASTKRFPDADRICVCDFETAFKTLSISQNAYILIITRGHLHDKIVLEQAVKTPAAYIGMIGSRKKRDAIYNALMKKGVSKETLAQVFSPVGIDIDAQTPEEIAVSIIGQLIQKRASTQKKLKLIK